MNKTKKEFYKLFVVKSSENSRKATNLNNESYVMGKADDVWQWIEKELIKAKQQGWDEVREGYGEDIRKSIYMLKNGVNSTQVANYLEKYVMC